MRCPIPVGGPWGPVSWPAVLILLVASVGNAGSIHSESGYILDVLDDGSFLLENGTLVRRADSTPVLRGSSRYQGNLLVGMEVEVSGVNGAPKNVIQAQRIDVLTDFAGKAEGTAVVEERQEAAEGIVLIADGRRLMVTGQTQLLSSGEAEEETIKDRSQLQPGVFVNYRGTWTGRGAVEVREILAWRDSLEPIEKEIYRKYEPKMLMPPQTDPGPLLLEVGANRYRVSDDSELQLYIDRTGTRLLPERWREKGWTEGLGYKFWFVTAVQERPQASSFPSGVVVVHTSLLRFADNEAQLAFAIAHEIAHVVEEHAWREYQHHRGKLLFLRWSTAGAGYAVESAIRRGYQRDLEAQADRLALWYMTEAGYDPREALKLLEKLARIQEGLSSFFWDTHRSYGARQKVVLQELAQYSAAGLDYHSLRQNSPEFSLFQAKLPTAKIKRLD